MPKKWEAEDELKLLLGIISITNAQVPTGAWPSVAAYMGEGYTIESVRQKFRGIKKTVIDLATTNDTAATPAATPVKTTKAKTPVIKTSTKATNSTAKGRKRKAASPAAAEDDDEEGFFQPKAKAANIKAEVDEDGDGAEVVKEEDEEEMEGEDDGVYA